MNRTVQIFLSFMLFASVAAASDVAGNIKAVWGRLGDVGFVVVINDDEAPIAISSLVLHYAVTGEAGKDVQAGRSVGFEHPYIVGAREAILVAELPVEAKDLSIEAAIGGRNQQIRVVKMANNAAWLALAQ